MSAQAIAIPQQQPVNDIAAMEARLQTLHSCIVRNQYEAGRILVGLRKQFAHGQWIVYLRQLCGRINMSQRCAYNYVETYETLKGAGGDAVVLAAEQAGFNINRKPVRLALVTAYKSHPESSPVKIAKFAKMALEHKNPAVDQLAAMRKYYRKYTNVEIERTGRTINGMEMTEFQILFRTLKPAQVPRGSEKVTAVLTCDQLRSVKGTFDAGITQLRHQDVKKYMRKWGFR